MRPRLRREQIDETLRRAGLDRTADVLGVVYGERTMLTVQLAFEVVVRIVVPADVIALQPTEEARPRTLFPRGLLEESV